MQSRLEQEIREQPEVLRRLLEHAAPVEAAAARIVDYDPRFVVIAARGTSDNAARYAQYLFAIRNRLVVALAAPSLHTMYGATPRYAGALVLGISQSGRSPDVVAVLDEARRQGALTLALTNDLDAPLAKSAELCLALHAGDEQSIAATKTYTAELVLLAMLSAAIARDADARRELDRIPAWVEAAIGPDAALEAAVAAIGPAPSLCVLGRGYNYCTAHEIALKIKETCSLVAEAYSPADFLHGPWAIVDEGTVVLLVAPGGRSRAAIDTVAPALRARRARLVAISDDLALASSCDAALALPGDVPEWLSPIAAVIPGQRLAVALALARGLDPEHPRGLAKVTLTR